MLTPATPAGHPALAGVWIASLIAIAAGGALTIAGFERGPDVAATGGAGLVAGWLVYLVRHRVSLRRLAAIERLIAAGELEAARTRLAPLLAAFPGFPAIQRLSGILLYASGDPLSASSLLEAALAGIGPEVELVTTLVASYAALNRGGDARRAARLLPRATDVRLALAWSELVALGGDRDAGADLVAELVHDPGPRDSLERRAMLGALIGIAAATAGDGTRARAAVAELTAQLGALAAADRAFLGYLAGVALRGADDDAGARAAFTAAIASAEGTIGAALARRERSHLPEEAAGAEG